MKKKNDQRRWLLRFVKFSFFTGSSRLEVSWKESRGFLAVPLQRW